MGHRAALLLAAACAVNVTLDDLGKSWTTAAYTLTSARAGFAAVVLDATIYVT